MKQALYAATVIIASMGQSHAQQITDSSGANLAPGEAQQVVAIASDSLKDPQSANFTKLTKGRTVGVCGYVNSKNSYGGYGGPRMFLVEIPSKNFFLLPTSSELRGMGVAALDNVQKMLPIMQTTCLNDRGNPIMD